MSAPSSEPSVTASEVSATEPCAKELDAIARKKAKDLRYYYKNRERILAAQMVQRREDPEFQERQRVKEEAAAAALALKEAQAAEKAREKEKLRAERQAAKEAAAAAKKEAAAIAKKEADAAAKQEKQNKKIEDQKRRRDAKIREKALALGLCLPPAENSDA